MAISRIEVLSKPDFPNSRAASSSNTDLRSPILSPFSEILRSPLFDDFRNLCAFVLRGVFKEGFGELLAIVSWLVWFEWEGTVPIFQVITAVDRNQFNFWQLRTAFLHCVIKQCRRRYTRDYCILVRPIRNASRGQVNAGEG